MLGHLVSHGLFWGQMLRRFGQIGAVAPSSRFLARRMVAALEPPRGATVVELGPGSGALTRYLHRLRPDVDIVAIEANPVLSRLLARRHPEIAVVEGCAQDLEDHLAEAGVEPGALGGVLCGLPLLNFEPDARDRLLATIARVLPDSRKLVAFTYVDAKWNFDLPEALEPRPSSRVLLNLPPSTVLTFRKTTASRADTLAAS